MKIQAKNIQSDPQQQTGAINKRAILGRTGEAVAASFLQKKGYRILERNYRNHFGEIDIVARDGDALVFIEVKTRKNTVFSLPTEAVTHKKQRQICRTALAYLEQHKQNEHIARFDVIGILLPDTGIAQIELICDAFELCAGY